MSSSLESLTRYGDVRYARSSPVDPVITATFEGRPGSAAPSLLVVSGPDEHLVTMTLWNMLVDSMDPTGATPRKGND